MMDLPDSDFKWPAHVLDKRVGVQAGVLGKIQHQLETKEKQVDLELKEVGFQPKSTTHAIFNQCRVFDSVFRKKLNETDTTSLIRDAFLGPSGLRANIINLKLDTFFNQTYVKQICRQADGYQPHLVSPEKGLKLLVKEAMGYVLVPAETCVDDVKLTLISTIQNAASDLSKHTFAEEVKSLRPTSQQMLLEICQRALDQWSEEAKEMTMKLVNMEGDYITSQFFRRLADSRAAAEAEESAGSEDGSDVETPIQTSNQDDSLKGISPLGGNAQDYMMGYLEKNSDTHRNIPLESWKWQKRWFVLSETKGRLYYFKDPDELPNYRGAVSMASCVVEDMAADTDKSKQSIQSRNGVGSFSLLISLSSVEAGEPILKDHKRLILRAENAASKYEWLARLRRCVAKANSSNSNSVSRRSSVASDLNTPRQKMKKNTSMPEMSPIKSVWGDMLDEVPSTKRTGSPFSAYFKQTLKGNSGKKDSEFYDILGNDLSLYTQMVLESLCRTIPKAIVHCQVKRAETEMLEHLYADVNELSSQQLESMTFEGSEVTQRRAALINAKRDIKMGREITSGLISSISGLLDEDETETIDIPSYVIELSGMSEILDQASRETSMHVGPYTPKALRSPNTAAAGNGTSRAAEQDTISSKNRISANAMANPSGKNATNFSSPAPPTRIKPRRRPPPPPKSK
jgi:dynamin GTPase